MGKPRDGSNSGEDQQCTTADAELRAAIQPGKHAYKTGRNVATGEEFLFGVACVLSERALGRLMNGIRRGV